ncbi:LysR family transcriptional regulator substrate-binding protein [Citricoccus sp.]|uniref:LysR family transcriptional regulator substrate-binding protein n=1 Tax=Citricoccus sp. TaxID=1978372 RepID=UPI00260DDA7A|nr:LysR family transcriptional regulator substrate-binding protein [Citricoccus sp.]HRO30408.1 LysR family transcriptional regulator substrate-binding protein [Citricoccus sp.]HRO92475.1 LysR family transcriptional regulator substrate-binding protein [Citricoccus sp.]
MPRARDRASDPRPAPVPAVPETLFLSTIPGASPSKWVDRFTSRERRAQLVNHDVGGQLAFLAPGPGGSAPRGLPQLGYLRWSLDSGPEALLRAGGIDPQDVHVVRFYEEDPVVCVGKDHLLAAWDPEADGPVPVEELDPQALMDPDRFAPEPPADPLEAPEVPGSGERMAVEIVASGTGHTVLPASVARMFGRKDVIVLPLSGHPGWGVGLAWLKSADSELVQDFVGAAKGRRPGSSRNDRGQSAAGSASTGASRAAAGGRPARKPSRAPAKSSSKPRKRR